jgi:hypothetical protein
MIDGLEQSEDCIIVTGPDQRGWRFMIVDGGQWIDGILPGVDTASDIDAVQTAAAHVVGLHGTWTGRPRSLSTWTVSNIEGDPLQFRARMTRVSGPDSSASAVE